MKPPSNKEKRSIKFTVKLTPTEFLALEMYTVELSTQLDWGYNNTSEAFRTLLYNSRNIQKHLKLINERNSQ